MTLFDNLVFFRLGFLLMLSKSSSNDGGDSIFSFSPTSSLDDVLGASFSTKTSFSTDQIISRIFKYRFEIRTIKPNPSSHVCTETRQYKSVKQHIFCIDFEKLKNENSPSTGISSREREREKKGTGLLEQLGLRVIPEITEVCGCHVSAAELLSQINYLQHRFPLLQPDWHAPRTERSPECQFRQLNGSGMLWWSHPCLQAGVFWKNPTKEVRGGSINDSHLMTPRLESVKNAPASQEARREKEEKSSAKNKEGVCVGEEARGDEMSCLVPRSFSPVIRIQLNPLS
ncbi:hypothetical protein CEXT_695281 [Caerostris extrusa]|uniref:Uncharacterized protein n=1 Tax=Caerostris extrusa TaxID=172846 RepID=A0AAV4MKY9_CAEEX|nr:hypothetical protein CEXT_695281 [Caerostris extrusa]